MAQPSNKSDFDFLSQTHAHPHVTQFEHVEASDSDYFPPPGITNSGIWTTKVQTLDDLIAYLKVHENKTLPGAKHHQLTDMLLEAKQWIGLQSVKEKLVHMVQFEMQRSCWSPVTTSSSSSSHDSGWSSYDSWNSHGPLSAAIITGAHGSGRTMIARWIMHFWYLLGRIQELRWYMLMPNDDVWERANIAAEEQSVLLVRCELLKSLPSPNIARPGSNVLHQTKEKTHYQQIIHAMDVFGPQLKIIFIDDGDSPLTSWWIQFKRLHRKIMWQLHTPNQLSGAELRQIFLLQLKRRRLRLAEQSQFNVNWFNDHLAELPFRGTSLELWIQQALILHSQSVFHLPDKHIIQDDCLLKSWLAQSTSHETFE